ncbi:MAG: MBL fold metallo-hydrolase, partial [Acetatifactor sp.]|nr:MBL fold metallo-hydrolase [Acetatifactor sp.]
PYTGTPDEYLKDGQELTLADMHFQVIATPGHTIGSCCYYFPEAGFLVSGDTLFAESVGRTDFPTGSMSSIVRSIKEKLYVLPGETKVYPGHGDSTTIEHEMRYNPFTA